MKNKTIQFVALIMLSGMVVLQSCKKEEDERKKPSISFITGAGLVSDDITVQVDTIVNVGITVHRTEDDLRTFNVSYAYDNASSTTTFSNEVISGSEKAGFTRNVQFQMRAVAGTEKWVFTTTDKDGNVASKTLIFTVQ